MARPIRGGTDVRTVLTGYLATTFPAALALFRAEHDLLAAPDPHDEGASWLPDPAVYLDHQPLEVGQFPTVNLVSARLTGMRRVDPDLSDADTAADLITEFVSSYDVEIAGWVSGTWEHVFNMRDDLIGALRYHLLRTPAFTFGDDDNLVVAEEIGMAEDKGEPIKQTGPYWGAAGSVAFTLFVPESITRPPEGVVLQTAVTVHPALAD